MPLEAPARIVSELTSRGYNADREAVTLIASADDPARALERVVEAAPEGALRLSVDHVRAVLDADDAAGDPATMSESASTRAGAVDAPADAGSDAADAATATDAGGDAPDHAATPDAATTADTGGARSATADSQDPSTSTADPDASTDRSSKNSPSETTVSADRSTDQSLRSVDIANDITGRSTGTGAYEDFVAVFRDRYERLGDKLRSRVNHRPAEAIQSMPGGSEASMVGMVSDIRSTASGHWLVELEDPTGTFPCLVMKDRDIAALVEELLHDEIIAVEGSLADDGGILFVDAMHFPDVPRTYSPNTADRHVQAALISDIHVGSQEFMADAWSRFADWLHTPEAEAIEYLLIAGDMVEGVGVYPDQDEELDIVDIYDQYRQFSEHLKEVPGDIEIVMIPGNHDAVRLAEPQPAFDEELRNIMSAHDARITGNPSTVTLEGVSILMYHGVSLDEVIAELPEEKASYDDPQKAMHHLLKKRHVAPQYGGHLRLAPEEKDYLTIDEVPDIFHTGHVHKLGVGKYHNVLSINSGCWQEQTAFQQSVNIDPDAGFAPVVDLDTLEPTIRKFH
ncbi:DNA-directed DNA polymerase II small subunit [Halostella salina]|uniref:DNA-directed DNA polymerase II small subunit n=1 Tax=Halostella salina TaxID=1547897 RepID=UPI000EF78651|nr:DNA-directed DNA polymerase II small subunit [Halostella salina]